MTKENLKRLTERIQNLITNPDESEKWGRVWDQGYNAACEQIIEIIKQIENEEI